MNPPACGPAKIDHVSNQVLVTIAVRNKKLTVFPQRGSEVVAYHRANPDQGNPAAPGEIRWVVSGLQEGQRVVIEAKDPNNRNYFPQTSYEVVPPNNTVCSGPPRQSPQPAYSLLWPYSVTLWEGTNRRDFVDPDVEIKDVP